MITYLKLKNWRSHLDSELKFSEGTNCFIGPMGAGKTSVLDGICFALFGTFPQLQQKKLKLEDMIMKKPKPQNQASIEIKFEVDGSEMDVKRTILKGKTTAELRRNGQLIQAQSSKVTEEIERVLKIDYDLFTRAIYSEQNQLDMFLTIQKGQRMKKIDELLAIDKFEKARMTTKSLENRCLDAAKERKSLLGELEKDESLKRLEILRNEIRRLVDDEKKYKDQTKQIENRKSDIWEDISVLKDQQKQMQKLNEELSTTTALLESSEKDIEKLKEELMNFAEKTTDELSRELEKSKDDSKDLHSNLETEENNLEKLRESFADTEAKIRIIESEKIPELKEMIKERDSLIAKLRKGSLEKLEKQLKEKEKDLENSQLKLQKSIAKTEELKESLEELKKVGSVCPICDNKLSDKKKENIVLNKKRLLGRLEKDSQILEPFIGELKKEIENLETKVEETEDLSKRYEELKNASKDLKKMEESLKELRLGTKAYEKEKKMLEKTIEMIRKNLEQYLIKQERIKQMIAKRFDIENKIQKIKDYNNRIDELRLEREKLSTFSPTKLQMLEDEEKSLIGLENQIKERLGGINKEVSEKQNSLEEIEKRKQELENYRQDIRKMEGIYEQFYLLENALTNTQEQLRKNFVSAVNQAMQSIWDELYPYKDFYSIRLGIQEGDYVLQLQDSTGWINADGVASGGERAMACLALRIAFALVLAPQLKWLVLDEPTHNLDARAVEELATVLRDRVSTLVDQIFLITHDPSLESAVSGFLYRVDREKEKDGYTKINLIAGPE